MFTNLKFGMMKTIFLYVSLALLLVATPSCSDWLDLKPVDGIVEGDFWSSKEDVHGAVIGCYTSLLNTELVKKMIYWGEARADLLTNGPSVQPYIMTVIRGEFGPENEVVKWDEFYTTINYCNKVIENAEKVKEVDRTFSDGLCAQYIAEATVIRSLMYFYLVRSFYSVPLVLTASNTDQQDYYLPKTDGEVILDTLIIQLARARNALPISYGSYDVNKGRFTYHGTCALLADIYLWKGDNSQCAALCDNIIKSGQYALVPVERTPKFIYDRYDTYIIDTAHTVSQDEMDKWFNHLYVAGNSVESIFELQFPQTHPSWGDPFYDIFNSASNRPRMAPKEDNLDGVLFPDYEMDGKVDRTIKDIRSLTYQNRYAWKYAGLNISSSTLRVNREYARHAIYRLPDIMLMRAEALTVMGQKSDDQKQLREAYELVKRVRERANAVETPATRLLTAMDTVINGKTLEKLILDERAREFLFEGKRWYDVLRFAKRDNYADDNLNYLTTMALYSAPPEKVASLILKYETQQGGPVRWFHYWPIHVSVVEINKNLEQNEYYQIQMSQR